jgi:glutaredoxin
MGSSSRAGATQQYVAIRLFTQAGCAASSAAKRWLEAHELPFRELVLDDGPYPRRELLTLGSRSTPTTVIDWPDGREDLIIGFNRSEMEQRLLG